MFSDNENPGAEHSAGPMATAAAAAPEETANVETAQAAVPTQESVGVAATPDGEPSVVTVNPAEPVAAPDGLAAVEHSNVSDVVEGAADSGEASTESNAEMEKLMEQYAVPHQAPAEGEIETGQVVAITDLGVVVNLGGKTEGLIPAQEFAELDGPFPLVVGEPVEIQRTGERKEGMVLLSYQRVRRRRAWGKIEEAYRTKADITGKIVDSIKGGLVVDIGVRAFLPASQADLHPVRDLNDWKGRELTVRVLKMNRKRGNIVVSRRAILDEQVASQRQSLLDNMAEGQIVKRRGQERYRLRRVRGPGRHRRAAAYHGHVLGPRGKPAGRCDARRRSGSQDPEVRQGKRARIARAQTIAARSLGLGGGALHQGYKAHRQNHGADGLRRVCGTRAGHRRTGARQRDELVQAQAASLKNRESGRPGGCGCAGR